MRDGITRFIGTNFEPIEQTKLNCLRAKARFYLSFSSIISNYV